MDARIAKQTIISQIYVNQMNEPAERVFVSCRIARSAIQFIRPNKQGGKGR